MESCKKCNSSEIKVKFEAKGEHKPYERKIEGVTQFMRNDTYYYQDEVREEHLIYTCETCGYRKAEKCKDKEANDGK